MDQLIVMKFGGTSVEDATAFARVADIVEAARAARPVVVVSAMSRVTDALLQSFNLAADGDLDGARAAIEPHLDRHLAVAQALLPQESRKSFREDLEKARAEMDRLMVRAAARELAFPVLQDEFVAYGERLSSRLLADVLAARGLPAVHADARRCIVTDESHGSAVPLLAETRARTQAELGPLVKGGQLPVLGGFIAASAAGRTTTLGRGGSDYSAAIIGAALDAREIQIWTDVTGVMTADPRLVPNARTIRRLSYAEAAELAYFGAKVLHPKTIEPAVERAIPVRVCNSRRPQEEGTLICAETEASAQRIKAIAHKTGITVVQITSARMLGAYGFLRALFEVFDRHRTVVDVVATSEVSVSLTLDDARSLHTIVRELTLLGTVRVEPERAIICVVGEGLRTTPGIAARVFGALQDINISLISQGASSINLTFVIDQARVGEAVARLHRAIFEEQQATAAPRTPDAFDQTEKRK